MNKIMAHLEQAFATMAQLNRWPPTAQNLKDGTSHCLESLLGKNVSDGTITVYGAFCSIQKEVSIPASSPDYIYCEDLFTGTQRASLVSHYVKL
jgi:hypothetical protein